VAAVVHTNVSTPTQHAAVRVYQPSDEIEEYFRITREIHRMMGLYFSEKFNEIDGIEATTPAGGFYFYADFNQLRDLLKKKGVTDSNQLGSSLLIHPYHVASITGDAVMIAPNDYGARIAFVDYDGREVFNRYKTDPPRTKEEEARFVEENAPQMIEGVESVKQYVKDLKT
jgi:aspartate aminotransferase